jgi:hypothetical protein
LNFSKKSKPPLPELTPETKGIAENDRHQLRVSAGLGIVARGWGEAKGVQGLVHGQGHALVFWTRCWAPGMAVAHGFVSHAKHISKVPNNTTISL